MRVSVVLKSKEEIEGVVLLKDESFVMLKIRQDVVRVIHWSCIVDVKRVFKGQRQVINLDVFKKTRE